MKKILWLTAVLTALLLCDVLWRWQLPSKGYVLLVTFAAFVTACFAWAFEKDEGK